jgi:RND family efflux transporter MFP subunit
MAKRPGLRDLAARANAAPARGGRRRAAAAALAIVPLLLVLVLAGCERGSAPQAGAPAVAPAKKAAGWHCPMHPSVRSDKPGSCPICGMSLVPDEEPEAAADDARRRPVKLYRSTMMPGETSPVPAKDSMGMDMVAVFDDEAEGAGTVAGRVTLTASPARRQMIDVRLGTAEKQRFTRTIRAAGRVEPDERRLWDVSLKFGAWVETLRASAVGDEVAAGAPLFDLYSPDFLEAHRAHVLALRAVEQAKKRGEIPDESSLHAARERLVNWDLTEEQVRDLEGHREPDTRITILAKRAGTLLKRDVVAGSFVQPGTTLLEFADLSQVWVIADVYESELAGVKAGLDADVRLAARPGEPIAAKVDFVYPTLDADTRTVRVRLLAANADGALKPGMYGTVAIAIDEGEQVVIDDDAVLDSGERQIVFVDEGEGRLAPREVVLGPRSEGRVVVRRGVEAGEKVVVSGNFLVDAESRLRASLRAAGGAAAAPAHGHEH